VSIIGVLKDIFISFRAYLVIIMPINKRSKLENKYSGFWLRFVATIIDGIVWLPLTFLMPRIMSSTRVPVIQEVIIIILIYTILDAIYEIILTYKFGGTVGKLLLGIKIVDENNKNITLGKSVGRYFSKYLSFLILCIGFLMIAFDNKKQGLHDKMVKSYVIDSNNNWQKRRKYVVAICIVLFVLYCAYSIYLGARDAIYDIKYSSHKIDISNPVLDIIAYCDNQTGYARDACYNYYSMAGEYLRYENLSIRIELCNKIKSKSENNVCLTTLAVAKSDSSICNNSRSKYFVNSCKKSVEFTSKIMPLVSEQYDLSNYNESLKAESIILGYVNYNDCVPNDLSLYTYGDIICILPTNVATFKIGKDGKHWAGITAELLTPDNQEPLKVINSIYDKALNKYYPDNTYNGFYSFFNTTDLKPGNYTLNYTIYDLVGKQKINLIRNITIATHPDYGNLTLENVFLGIDYNAEMCSPHNGAFDRYIRVCLRPKVSGFQKMPNGLYFYNMGLEVTNSTGQIFDYDNNIFKDQKPEALIDSTIDDPYAITYTKNYPSGNYSFILIVKDVISRKTITINQSFTIMD